MAKEVKIKVEGCKVLSVNHDVYEVELPNKVTVKAHVSGRMRMNIIRILPGDTVTLEFSPYDTEHGVITYRSK